MSKEDVDKLKQRYVFFLCIWSHSGNGCLYELTNAFFDHALRCEHIGFWTLKRKLSSEGTKAASNEHLCPRLTGAQLKWARCKSPHSLTHSLTEATVCVNVLENNY